MGLFDRFRRSTPASAPETPAPEGLLVLRAANLQGVGGRENQEDSFAILGAADPSENGLFALVADGMGGMEDGKRVSESAVAGLLAGFNEMDRRGDLPGQIRECILDTAGKLYQRFQGAGGTTLVVCVFFQERLYWASVGDSYLYLQRGRGLYRLNQEHNYRTQLYLEAVRSGHLDPAEANADPDGHRLSQFLGKEEVEAVDLSLRPLRLRDGDTVLLCSDGVGGVLEQGEILSCLSAPTPAQACGCLDRRIRALERRSQDNYTALAVKCGY